MGISSIDRATQNVVQWAARGEWEALQREFFEAHFESVTDGLDLPDDAFEVLPDEGAGMLSVFVLEEFFTARFGTHGELNVVDDYLKRRGWRESVPARRYLEGLRDSTLSLYEVIDLVRGRHMTVRAPPPQRRLGAGRGEARLARRGTLEPSGRAHRSRAREVPRLVIGWDPPAADDAHVNARSGTSEEEVPK